MEPSPPGALPPPPAPPLGWPPAPPRSFSYAVAGGTILIASGTMTLVLWVSALTLGEDFWFLPFPPLPGALAPPCGPIAGVASVISVVGGVTALHRRAFSASIVGSVFGLVSVGPFGTASLLSLVALVFLGMARSEFR